MPYFPIKSWIKFAGIGLGLLLATILLLLISWYKTTQERVVTSETLAKVQIKRQLILNMHNAIHNRLISLSKLVSLSDPFDFDDEYLRYSNYASHFINSKNILLEFHIKDIEERREWNKVFDAVRVSSDAANATVEQVIKSHQSSAVLHYLNVFTPAYNDLVKQFLQRMRSAVMDENKLITQLAEHEQNIDKLVLAIVVAFMILGALTASVFILSAIWYRRTTRFLNTHVTELAELISSKNLSGEEQIRRLLKFGCSALNMDTGTLSKLNKDTSTALLINYYSSVDTLDIGNSITSDNTICGDLCTAPDGFVATIEGAYLKNKPLCYDSSKFLSYIAKRIDIENTHYGVLSFSSRSVTKKFDASNRDIVDFISGWISFLLAKKFTAEELRQTQLDAENANTLKNMFLSNISHELRTPLNAIIGYSDLLAEELSETQDDDSLQDVKRISSSGVQLLSLINEILDLSNIEAGKFDLNSDYFYVNSVLEMVQKFVMPDMQRHENYFRIIKPNADIMLYTDRIRLKQILSSILIIACQFNKNAEIDLHVAPRHIDGKDWVDIIITDHGTNMSSEQLHRIFKPFTQAESSFNTVYGGTGLELTIAKRICQLMGGDIRVGHNKNGGTRFTVTLPSNVISQQHQTHILVG